LILLLYSCNTLVEIKPPTGNEGSYLKSIRKFILYFPEKIQVEMVKAGMNDSVPSPAFLREMNKDEMEKAFSKSIVGAFNQYGNSKLTAVPSDRISFVEEVETEKERGKILESIGVDSRIEVTSKVKLDYPTRVPDLGAGNFLYYPLLLDLWWIDLAGAWRVEHTLEFSVTDIKTGIVKYKSPPVTKSKSTRTFILSNLNASDFNEALEKSTEEIILKTLGIK
jgi:hypothetical protein